MTTQTVPGITRIFTFGYGQVCPFTGDSLADRYTTVIAPDRSAARRLMFATFGRDWAFEYDATDPRFTDYAPRMTEHARLALGTPAADDRFGYSRELDDDPTPVSPGRVPLHTGYHEAGATGEGEAGA
jgi:hypothetical protein